MEGDIMSQPMAVAVALVLALSVLSCHHPNHSHSLIIILILPYIKGLVFSPNSKFQNPLGKLSLSLNVALLWCWVGRWWWLGVNRKGIRARHAILGTTGMELWTSSSTCKSFSLSTFEILVSNQMLTSRSWWVFTLIITFHLAPAVNYLF